MGFIYWLHFIFMFAIGLSMVQISHGKWLARIKFSPTFLKVLRYLGLLVIIYSCYAVMLDFIVLTNS